MRDSRNTAERLAKFPELHERIDNLLKVVENSEGDVIKADDAEQKVVEEVRQIGQEAMQGWAASRNNAANEEWKSSHKESSKHEKKRSSGVPHTEK